MYPDSIAVRVIRSSPIGTKGTPVPLPTDESSGGDDVSSEENENE